MVEVAVQAPQFVVKEVHVLQVLQTLIERLPAVLACRESGDSWHLTWAVNFDQQRRASTARLERVSLWRAAVPAALVDLKFSMPIAQG